MMCNRRSMRMASMETSIQHKRWQATYMSLPKVVLHTGSAVRWQVLSRLLHQALWSIW